MNSNILAEKIFKKFSYFEGNQHIASEYALKCVLQLINDFNVKSVLEVGIGIGCIADSILEYSQEIEYTATESNEFCLESIKNNVNHIERVFFFDNLSQVPENKMFDFIIIDGSDSSLFKIKKMCKSNTVIFIEGGRSLQTNELKKIFPKILHAEMISDYKNPSYGPFSNKVWGGGGQLLFPFPSMKMKIYYLALKINTYFKRKKRK